MQNQSVWIDSPAERTAGLSPRRERIWGLIGGGLGALVGTGAFLIAWLVQREPWGEMSKAPYPTFFSRREVMPLDLYFLLLLIAGIAFLLVALIFIRTGRYPRTDGFGAALVGMVFTSLGGVVLFLRLWAALHG